VVLSLPFAFLIFNFAFLHSGATARDLHPLPYSPRSFARGTRTLLFEKNKGNPEISFPLDCGADVITPGWKKSKVAG
jgi:hypothetical protein